MPNPRSPIESATPERFSLSRLSLGNLAAIAAGAVILLIVLGTLPRIPW